MRSLLQTTLRAVTWVALGLAISTPAMAQKNSGAYDIAIQCFVVDGFASKQSREAGDSQAADTYKAKSQEAFDVAQGLAQKLGYTDAQVHSDIEAAMGRELPRLFDKTYFNQAAATCKAYGMM